MTQGGSRQRRAASGLETEPNANAETRLSPTRRIAGAQKGASEATISNTDAKEKEKDKEKSAVRLPPELIEMIFEYVPACAASYAFKEGGRADATLCNCDRLRELWFRFAKIDRLAFHFFARRIWSHLGYGTWFWRNPEKLDNLIRVLTTKVVKPKPKERQITYLSSVTALRMPCTGKPSVMSPKGSFTWSVEGFAAVFDQFTNLRRLQVGKPVVSGEKRNDAVIWETIGGLNGVRSVCLDVSDKTNNDLVTSALERLVPELRSLEVNCFSGKKLASFLLRHLPPNLANLKIFKTQDGLTSEQFQELLTRLTTLESLDVLWRQPPADPLPTPPQPAHLATLAKLKHLTLRYPHGEEGPLPAWLPECRQLESLELQGIRLYPKSMRILSSALERIESFKTLTLICILHDQQLTHYLERDPDSAFPKSIRTFRVAPINVFSSSHESSFRRLLKLMPDLQHLELIQSGDSLRLPESYIPTIGRFNTKLESLILPAVSFKRAELPSFLRDMKELKSFMSIGSDSAFPEEWVKESEICKEFGLQYRKIGKGVMLESGSWF